MMPPPVIFRRKSNV